MAEAVVSVAVKTIGKLLIDEGNFLHGVRDQAELLQTELKRMSSFLKDADARQSEQDRVRQWVSEIREIAYEAEIVLEIYALKVASRRNGGIIKNVIKRFSCILRDCYNRHKVGSEIQNLITKISNVTESFQNYGIRAIMEQECSSRSRLQEIRRTYSRVADDREDFVGLENEIETLASHVIREDEQGMRSYKVVSICGMGGLGKTTLARKVYNHPKVRRHFDGFAWVCISQQWQTKELLEVILLKLVSEKKEEIQMRTVEEMVTQISQIQQTQKCLIVLDDIWSADAWECIKHAFPFGEKCSKILLTTRNKEVASHIGPNGFHHQPRFLSINESWELLKKKIFGVIPREDSQDIGEMEDIGKKMVEECGGLPLAVVVLGGILATKQSLRDWKNVYLDIRANLGRGKSIGEHQDQVQKILELSYNDLPYQLKPCFLYLGQSPEDSDIDTESLYQRWIAEEMVSLEDRSGDESMMEVAEKYLRELAQRYMVEVVEEKNYVPKISRLRSCRLHDLMRELCLRKAKEENLYTLVNYGDTNGIGSMGPSSSASLPPKIHRLVVLISDGAVPEFVPPEKKVIEHLRSLQISVSLMYISRIPKKLKNYQLNSFQLLKVLIISGLRCKTDEEYCNCFLDVDDIDQAKLIVRCGLHRVVACGVEDAFRCLLGDLMLPKGFENLKNLRYFCLQKSRIWMLPSSIGNLEHLETLDLRDADVVTLPNILWKMKGLRHLYLPRIASCLRPPYKVQLGELTKLEILGNFDSLISHVKDLWKLINLRELEATVNSELDLLEEIINCISNSNRLGFVNLRISFCDLETEKGSQILAQMLCLVNLHVLEIIGNIDKLPISCDPPQFSTSLFDLRLTLSEMEEDPMEILGKFPSLRRLALEFDAFAGKEMICSKMSFPLLEFLELCSLDNLEKWRVDEGAMPNLSHLEIGYCEKLEMIPEGLRFVTALKELTILGMPPEFVRRVKVVNGEEGEDFDKVRHVPSITIVSSSISLI